MDGLCFLDLESSWGNHEYGCGVVIAVWWHFSLGEPGSRRRRRTMQVSALTSSLPLELPSAIDQLGDLGFQWIDVPPAGAEGQARQRLQNRDLSVTCVALERGLPSGMDLASSDAGVRSRTIKYFCRAIESTHRLGAPVSYITPPNAVDDGTRQRWTDSLLQLADHARQHTVRVCIEHFPRRLLPTVASTLGFLRQTRHEQLALLVDVGHCLISREEPAQAVSDAGKWLGYMHFDDNDGQEDHHWALLTGKLTEEQIHDTIQALQAHGYQGGLCLELHPEIDDPVGNLRRGKALLELGKATPTSHAT